MKRRNIILPVVAGLIVLYAGYRLCLRYAVQSRLDAIRQAGYPATWAELDKWYRQPSAGENAADIFGNAFAHYQMWTNQLPLPSEADATNRTRRSSRPQRKSDLLPIVGMAKLPAMTEPLPAEMEVLVAAYASDNAEALSLLHQAVSVKSCRYPIDLTQAQSTLLPHLTHLRHAARLLCLETLEYEAENKPEQAVESVITSFGVSRSLSQEPLLISYLVDVACHGIAFDNLEHLINRMPLTDEQLTTLGVAIEQSKDAEAFTRAFVGERCIGINTFETLGKGLIPFEDRPSLLLRTVALLYQATGLLALDERSYLDIMQRLINATRLSPPESLAAARSARLERSASSATIQATIWRLGDGGDLEIKQPPRYFILSRMMLPALGAAFTKEARFEAKLRDAQTALAIERYRLVNGSLPGQLNDLVPAFLPAVPADPFDGKPLRYKLLATGYIVYSVGEDREDNGGTEKTSKGQSYVPGTDITFTVER
jgi:hypothetical protein